MSGLSAITKRKSMPMDWMVVQSPSSITVQHVVYVLTSAGQVSVLITIRNTPNISYCSAKRWP